MPSFAYNSALEDMVRGNLNFATDVFKVMLVTSAYAEDKDAHTKRSDVTGEVTGAGYTTGGMEVVPVITHDPVTDRVEVVFPQVAWPDSTLVARKAIYYKSRGGSASADELVALNDFGSDIVANNVDFALQPSTLRLINS